MNTVPAAGLEIPADLGGARPAGAPPLLRKRVVGMYYVWQPEAHGLDFLYGDLPAEIYSAHPTSTTPQGHFVRYFRTAREADRMLDKIIGLLARWWCELNRGEWPEDFPLEQIRDLLGRTDRGVLWAQMRAIADSIGMKECLRAWNAQRGVPANEFEEWWNAKGHLYAGWLR